MSDNNTDAVQHGIDDNSNDDALKGLELGALGGGAVGATAGAAGGPIGAAVGGSVGSLVSGAAVRTVDDVDNDDTLPGIGANDTTQPSEDSVDLKPIEATSASNATTPSDSSDVYLDTSEPPLGTGTSGDDERSSHASGSASPTEASQSAPDIVTGEPSASNAGATSSGASDVGLAGAIINGPGGAITGNDGSTNNAKGTTAVAGEDTKNI